MKRFISALALAPVLFATAAQAQTVSDDVAKQLWCGEAYSVYVTTQLPSVPEEQKASAQALLDGANKLIDQATQAYLNAGFTEEQVNKVKADLIAEVTPVVTTGAPGKYSPSDCQPLITPLMVEPSAPSSEESAPDTSSSDAPASDASSSSAQ